MMGGVRACLAVTSPLGSIVSAGERLPPVGWQHLSSQAHAPLGPGASGTVQRFPNSLKHEHLYQREIEHAAVLAEEVRSFLATFNDVRPHESLAWRQPSRACP